MEKNKISIQQIKKGVIISISAQSISLVVSFVLNLVVPKFIDEYQYAYWQTFMLYTSYVGVLHFGLIDGIVLRYSQYDYEELDKTKLRSQFLVLLLLVSFLATVTILIASIVSSGISKIIIFYIAIGIVTRNIFTYSSYSLQITNRISQYAALIIKQRIFFGAGIIILLFSGAKNFYWFCIIDLLSDFFGILISVRYNRALYLGPVISFKEIIKETRINISTGVLLLVANWASNFLMGSAKMVIQWHWDALVFGKVSFAFSISNLFMNFLNAISVVLFPSLKRMDQVELPRLYKNIRDVISQVLFFIMLLYFPGCWILEKWIPRYEQSLTYFGIILPIIIFASKVSLLTNNYLKTYRAEKIMLKINLFSMTVAMSCYLLCAYILNSLTLLLASVLIITMMRSILSEIIVMRIIHVKFVWDFVLEAVMTIFFVICAHIDSLFVGAALYCAVLIIYFWINKSNLAALTRLLNWKEDKI